jgi:hypothetical protein
MEAPIKDPITNRTWQDFFIEISDLIGSPPPHFQKLESKAGYDSLFVMWCMNVQTAINDVTPGIINDPPLNERIEAGRFGKAFADWFMSVAQEV